MMRSLFLLPLALAAGACTGLRTVHDGVFRAPQMHEDLLARTIEAKDIQTVVCLRGNGDGSRSSERAAVGTDAVFWQVPMSATRLPRPETLLALWQVASVAKRPLLFHCRAGVDRTGLASAILVLHDTDDLDAARSQLALLPYGHVAWSKAGAMDEVLDAYAESHAAGMPFPHWVRTVYAMQFAARR